MIRLILAALFFLAGLFVFFSGVLGLFRFRNVLERMHAAALGDTLGIVCIIMGAVILRGWSFAAMKMLLIPLFLFLTSPVLTHLLAEAEVLSLSDNHGEFREEDRR